MDTIKMLLKRKYNKTEAIGILTITFVVGVCVDVILGGESIIMVIISGGFIYFSQRSRKKGKLMLGNILLGIGAIILIGGVLTSLAFYFVIATIGIYYGYHLYKSGKNPEKLKIELEKPTIEILKTEEKAYVKVEPFFKNMLAGEMRNINEVYELDDINIQYGFGDIHLDLTHAMVPAGETVILIRGFVGNIRLYIPYDIDLSIHTSTLIGKIDILEDKKTSVNLTQKYQTKEYQSSNRKIKIVTSLLIGDIEVKNI